MKYPRSFDGKRVNWEDVNEVIAAKIAQLLNLDTVEAEIAIRNGKRGCLMRNFVDQYDADLDESGAVLLDAEFGCNYDLLQRSNLQSQELIEEGFSLIEQFSYFKDIKFSFIAMNIF